MWVLGSKLRCSGLPQALFLPESVSLNSSTSSLFRARSVGNLAPFLSRRCSFSASTSFFCLLGEMMCLHHFELGSRPINM